MADVFKQLEDIRKELMQANPESKEALEAFRIRFLGTKNILKDIFAAIREVPNERKKEFGQLVNDIKGLAETRFKEFQEVLGKEEKGESANIDLTLPVNNQFPGARHPITIVRDEIVAILNRIGYTVAEGPEIEDDWHNFTALAMPDNHPARDMQDTFYIQTNPDILLRTHTSNVQIRVMEQQKPPIRIIAPGRTYRNETISARAHCIFHQVELLYIDQGVSFADLKQTLLYLAKELFGETTKIRLRPSYFPFTEPSAELDVSCFICNQHGCNICKHSGWVEIGGAGMVDPAVLEACGIDPETYSGFAFGMGLERMAMLKWQINDIRLFSENDIRFLKQFEGL
jgi:phenylalanyl-tRNA synthetase alpha chain